MKPSTLTERFALRHPTEQALVSILALMGPINSRSRLMEYLAKANLKSPKGTGYNGNSMDALLAELVLQGLIAHTSAGEYQCAPALVDTAIHSAITRAQLDSLCAAVESIERISSYAGQIRFANYQQGIRALRRALISGKDRDTVSKYLVACSDFSAFRRQHPYVDICGRPFTERFMALLHPEMQEAVLATLLQDAMLGLRESKPIVAYAESVFKGKAPGTHRPGFIAMYAEYVLLSGQFDQAENILANRPEGPCLALHSAMALLRGKLEPAIDGFEAALKAFRATSMKRTNVFSGLTGFLHMLALLRSAQEKHHKKALTYLDIAVRRLDGYHPVFEQLRHLHQVQTAQSQTIVGSEFNSEDAPLYKLFFLLIDEWLGVPLTDPKFLLLQELHLKSEAAGQHFIAAQTAELLGRQKTRVSPTDSALFLQRAETLRRQQGSVCLLDWFEKQEPWQRQLAALAQLSAPAKDSTSTSGPTPARLVWEIQIGPRHIALYPREQKRKGQTAWTGGRAVALKRLSESPEEFDYLSPQDRQVCACIKKSNYGYYGGIEYEINSLQALPHLINHPLVFSMESPGVRVEILRGMLELEIKKADANTLTLRLQPPLGSQSDSVIVSRETPTRLRVIEVTEDHRRIGNILGESLNVPVRAKAQVLDAIRAISSLITIQSDLDVLPSNLPQVEADSRLHVHLMPLGAGLKVSLRVRPFTDAGPYYPPGAGAENVIAEIAGKPLQAHRHLAQELEAAKALETSCQVWRDTLEEHGERTIEDPQDCLELLLQLQAQADTVVLAWPEGEKFKVSRELGGSHFSMAIKRQQDWFSVTGELQVDDKQVLDLQRLLELTATGHGRFIHLGDNQFLALTEAFRRRLDELRAYSEQRGKDLRIHPLAAGALQDLATDAGKLKTDKFWKEHLAKLGELDTLQPVLPATLRADLRDYQFSGFEWLNRLAHWGVGACLADDMGLGKTLQALALLLSRGPQGPALVVAPTSVCMNWMGEVARFAPTLRVIVFGSGDRQQTLTDLQPLDLVVTSYGLLQQEAERFAAVRWHTLVLDEAQAIKNQATKRSQAAMALQGDFRVILSGTPLENHLGELWNLFRFINPGLLGSLEQFNERYAGPIERLQSAEARNRLRKLIGPFILRRTKSQVLSELPSRTEILRQVALTTEEKALYEALRRQALERLAAAKAGAGDAGGKDNGQRYIEILAEIMKLRRACCNPALVAPELGLPSSKLAAFGELLDELLANRHKALVFSQFVAHLSLIRAYLDERGVRYQYLDGSTPMQERKQRVDAFQAGEGDVFLISLKAGGTGLNLTAADYVIHMDPWWNPAVEDQASDRAHRIGQTRPVTIYRLVAQDTIEEKIVDLHKTKRALADSLLEGSDMAAKMSADDMLALLQEEWQPQGE
ncbi:MAG: DEAD/DEAH box helicase [Rhodoferax sp.]|nr:DEAD/DEAH box helicase [Rhodoferax sp.]MDP3651491.1 DEAD/DEAH box helicase [Rhodoferax sp.]